MKIARSSFGLRVSLRLFVIAIALCIGVTGCSDLSFGVGPVHVDTYSASARELRNNQPENLELSFSQCKKACPARGTEIKQVEWTDDDEFSCVVTIDANCSDDFWAGDYKIEDESSLILEYTTLRAGGEDACLCQVELRYRITDLEKRDYSITVQQADLVVP